MRPWHALLKPKMVRLRLTLRQSRISTIQKDGTLLDKFLGNQIATEHNAKVILGNGL